MEFEYHTVDVFTDRRFGGNPLAVFPAAGGLDAASMQALAAEMNYSETTFVLPPENPAHTARVRIFTRTAEMPFAGHPNVGTAFVLSRLGLATGTQLTFEEIAGLVHVRLDGSGAQVRGAEIDAPMPLTLKDEIAAEAVAGCASLTPGQILTRQHAPVRASVGVDFILAEVTGSGLTAASPDLAEFRALSAAHPEWNGRASLFLYTREGAEVRARMFAPLAGTVEDPATGSANATLAALLLSLSGGSTISYRARQGVEMGRESHLALRAWRAADGIRASVGGPCVPVFSGRVIL